MNPLPLLVEPAQLAAHFGADNLLIVDLCKSEFYPQQHIPGAVHLPYPEIVAARAPVVGLLPDADTLSRVFSALGMRSDTHVVAYDDEGGGKAARLLWTLDAMGHARYSLLNGGLQAWTAQGLPIERQPVSVQPTRYQAVIGDAAIASKKFILAHLNDPAVCLLDARSAAEYSGAKRFAERGGHIPGAANLDWLLLIDQHNQMRLKPAAEIEALLAQRGISRDKTVVNYCHSHHRSALTYYALKLLGYPSVLGYPGSWSDWGNDPATPVACP